MPSLGIIEVYRMNRKLFGFVIRMLVVAAPVTLVGCGGGTDSPAKQ